MVNGFVQLVGRDLRLALRQRADAGMVVLFFVLTAALFPFGVGPEANLLARIAPGVIWVTALLAVLLSLERLFLADYEDGALELLALSPEDKVLEIGTGSGYQAALLAEIAEQVYTIEIIEPLYKSATKRLAGLGYSNVTTQLGDGYYGWPQHAPFDAIMVTAAAGQVPPPLIRQLKPGGKMIIPVGGAFMTQFLLLIEKRVDGTVSTRQILPVRFVPLTGEH